jgi:hypothetical protein
MIGILCLLFGLVLVKAGVDNAQKLWDVATSNRQFTKSAGVVEAVIKHDNPVYESADYNGVRFLAEVKFSYSVNGARYLTNTLSASCSWCSPKDVLDVTGVRPGKLAVGTPVAVFFELFSKPPGRLRRSSLPALCRAAVPAQRTAAAQPPGAPLQTRQS